MQIIDLKEANIETMINLYNLYCKEIRIPVNKEIAQNYFNRVNAKIKEGLPLYFKISANLFKRRLTDWICSCV